MTPPYEKKWIVALASTIPANSQVRPNPKISKVKNSWRKNTTIEFTSSFHAEITKVSMQKTMRPPNYTKSTLPWEEFSEKWSKLVPATLRELVPSAFVKIGPNSLKRMPATIHGLRRMHAPWYCPIASWFGYLFMIWVWFNISWGERYRPAKTGFFTRGCKNGWVASERCPP